MRNLILGLVLGIVLSAGATYAFHTTEHGFFDQVERDRDRSYQEQERWNQQMYRDRQEMKTPC